jgi:uncharacterized protein (DUF2336 family)
MPAPMSAPSSKLASSKLVMLAEMAATQSGDVRRATLAAIADAFRPESHALDDMECAEFDRILSAVTSELAVGIRMELSGHIAAAPAAFRHTARTLAFDEIAVARPVIERSNALSDADLLDLIVHTSQDHMLAVTKRPEISEAVSGALVAHGEDGVVASLLQNEGARIDRPTYEKVADRAGNSAALQEPLIRRESVPLDLLNDLYSKIEPKLRREVLRRFDGVPLRDLSVAMLLSRRRWLMKYGALPPDYETSRRQIDELARANALKPPLLVRFLRERKKTEFKFAFAALTSTDYELVNRLVERHDLEGLGILARAGGFDRALFVTIAMLLSGPDQRMANVEAFGAQYEAISAEHAQKVIGFWRLGSEEGTAPATAAH